MAAQDNRHIASLDGLRGFAALAVFLAHAGSEGFVALAHTYGLGKIGVALFYALSGFLMAHLYLQRSWTRPELRNYFVARFARILPLFYVAVLLGALLLYSTGFSVYGFRTLPQIALNLGFLRGNGVLWSIPVEVQFYLLFALLWAAASRGRLLGATIGLLGVQLAALLALGGGEANSNALVYWLHYFVVGIVISQLYAQRRAVFDRLARQPAIGGISAVLAVLCVLLMPGLRLALGWPALPIYADPFVLLGVFLFVLLALLGRGPFRLFATPPLRWLGARSFGIYLFHVPVLLIAEQLLRPDLRANGLGFVLALAVTLTIANLLHHLVELPAGRAIRSRLLRPVAAKPRQSAPLVSG
jgi:peptidoglycan/LPS O-acetylase OafA/YrhL